MIELANKKVKKKNIPFHIFPDLKINNRENLYKITKNMTKKIDKTSSVLEKNIKIFETKRIYKIKYLLNLHELKVDLMLF